MHDRPDTHGHFVAGDKREAARLAVAAGVNIELPDPDCYRHLVELVQSGDLQERQLDELIAPMLLWKFKLGLFDSPYVDPDAAERLAGCEAHQALALQAAREVITLLKNDGGLLPLNPKKLKTVAVIGPNANRPLLGGYSGAPKQTVSVLDGIRARLGDGVKVLPSEGCTITLGGSWQEDAVRMNPPAEDRKLIAEAVAVAARADVIIVAIGGNEQTSREAWSRAHLGDRTSLDLVGLQEELVDALLATGKPVVALLFNGRPLSIARLAEKVPAIIECWYPGQAAGTAVAEVLFGDVNPGGKLPISIPRSVGQLPIFYNHKPSARRGFLWDDAKPLFAFGFGLSYTTFQFQNARLAKKRIPRGDTARLRVEVTNTGARAGTEVVQLYVRDRVSSVTRPVKELKAFAKVTLQPGETRTVVLALPPAAFAFYDVNMNYTVEPGEFVLLLGSSSRDEDLQSLILTVV